MVVVEPGSTSTHFMKVSKENHSENVVRVSEIKDGEDVAKRYAESSTRMFKAQLLMERFFAPVTLTNEALEASILDRIPRTRYTVGFDTGFLVPLSTLFPDSFKDLVAGFFFRQEKRNSNFLKNDFNNYYYSYPALF